MHLGHVAGDGFKDPLRSSETCPALLSEGTEGPDWKNRGMVF